MKQFSIYWIKLCFYEGAKVAYVGIEHMSFLSWFADECLSWNFKFNIAIRVFRFVWNIIAPRRLVEHFRERRNPILYCLLRIVLCLSSTLFWHHNKQWNMANMIKFNLGYSLKNIPIPPRNSYLKTLIVQTENFIKRLRWRVFWHQSRKNSAEKSTLDRYLYLSRIIHHRQTNCKQILKMICTSW